MAITESIVPLAQAASIALITWVLWSCLHRWLDRDSLANIPGPVNTSWLSGHFEQLWDVRNGWAFHKGIAEKYGSVIKLAGPFGTKSLYVYDPKALHHILVKDLYTFDESPGFTIGADMSLGKGLFATSGDMHRRQRKMLNPVFSTVHMREMVPIFYDAAEKLRDTFLKKTENGPQEIDVTHWMARMALELIGQSGMGYSFDSLAEDAEEHPYCKAVKMYIPVMNQMMTPRFYILPFIHKLNLPPRFLRWLVDIVPWKNLHAIRDIADVMHSTAVDVVERKKKAIGDGVGATSNQIGRGKDIMSILVKGNMEAAEADRLSDEEVIGQVKYVERTLWEVTCSKATLTTNFKVGESPWNLPGYITWVFREHSPTFPGTVPGLPRISPWVW